MLRELILLCISILLAMCLYQKPKDKRDKTEENFYQQKGKETYEFFMKWGTSDKEMERLLLANEQELKEFEGCSRIRICEMMRRKAELTGKAYTRRSM